MDIVMYDWLSNRYSLRFSVAKLRIFFSRLSTLSRALGVDSVLFTEIQQGSFGNAEKFCGSPPCAGAIISLQDTLLVSLGIAVSQIFGYGRNCTVKFQIFGANRIAFGWKAAKRTVSFNSRILPGHGCNFNAFIADASSRFFGCCFFWAYFVRR